MPIGHSIGRPVSVLKTVAVTGSLQVTNAGNNVEMGPSLALLVQPSMEEYGFVIYMKKEW